MRRALAAAVLVALGAEAQDGGPRAVVEVRTGQLVTVDGALLEVQGGAYLPTETLLATASELAKLRAENEALKSTPALGPWQLVAAALAGVVVGGAVVYLATR